jgi:hypothetical protein
MSPRLGKNRPARGGWVEYQLDCEVGYAKFYSPSNAIRYAFRSLAVCNIVHLFYTAIYTLNLVSSVRQCSDTFVTDGS